MPKYNIYTRAPYWTSEHLYNFLAQLPWSGAVGSVRSEHAWLLSHGYEVVRIERVDHGA